MRNYIKSSSGFIFIVALLMGLLPLTANAAAGFAQSSSYLSPEKTAPIAFTGVGVTWNQYAPAGTSARILMHFYTDQGWGPWEELAGDVDSRGFGGADKYSTFLPTAQATRLQYKILLESNYSTLSPKIDGLEITYLNAKNSSVVSGESLVAAIALPAPVSVGAKIIPRRTWGADESLRVYNEDRSAPQLVAADPDFAVTYSAELKIVKKVGQDENGNDLTWPLEYPEKISKIIIHHTATTNNLDDPAQAIRNIYYWHSITKGWGDIGYNYIIDPKGNIYEGRAGGDGVVGGHAGKANIGSIGIAVLGNYQDNPVPVVVVQSLAALIKIKAERFGFDPAGQSEFRGEISSNVLGHRDVMSTACPGEKLYAYLPLIRNMAKGGFKTSIIDKRRLASMLNYDFSLQSTIPAIKLDPGGTQRLKLTLKNTGSIKWGAGTHLLLSADDNAKTFLNTDRLVKSSLAGKEVLPGGTVTFDVLLQATYAGGISTFELFPFIDGKTKIDKYISIPLQVKEGRFDYEFVKLDFPKTKLKIGETAVAKIYLKNTGNLAWKREGNNRIMIGTEEPRDHTARILEKPGTRLAGLLEREVKPGQTGTFSVKVKAPQRPGLYREYYAPVIEAVTWLPFKKNYLEIMVYDANYSAKYTGASQSLAMLPSESKALTFEFQNTGGSAWKTTGDMPLTFNVNNSSLLRISPAVADKTSVLPGQSVKVSLTVASPAAEGTYNFALLPKVGRINLLATPQQVVVKVSKTAASLDPVRQTAPADLIKVDLSFRGNPVISADSAFRLYDGEKFLAEFLRNERVSVVYEQLKYQVRGDKLAFVLAAPPRFEPLSGGILRIDNYENRPAWDTSYNDNEYRGKLYINWYENALHVVNELALEDYLRGLAEISASEPYEKIKAIIVLARSYARFYTTVAEKFPGAPFHLSDDPERSQKYLGYGFEKRNPTGVRAVNDTSGIVVTYGGKVIKTPYFSADDGRTKSAEEVWGWKDSPYLKSVDDPGCVGKTPSGHGVGMSGCGALYFAGQGKTYDQIIKYYFQGVELKKI